MRLSGTLATIALGLVLPALAQAQQAMTVGDHQITVDFDDSGSSALSVDGNVLHSDWMLLLDPEPMDLGGLTVVTGAAGAGGNACNAAPFVLELPKDGAPRFWGPIDSCAWFTAAIEAERLIFTSDPLPGNPGETWVWTPGQGFSQGAATEFTATAGWDAFDSLADAHPADALALSPVLDALKAGLGADYPVFAERISDLGSGGLTEEGYLGNACLKFTCYDDWAVLYLHRESQTVFAAWAVAGEEAPHLWPSDRLLWPVEAIAWVEGHAADPAVDAEGDPVTKDSEPPADPATQD